MLNNTIITGLNNPDCSFYVGAFLGTIMFAKLLLFSFFVYVILKIIDKIAIDPFLNWFRWRFLNRWIQ